MRFLLLYIFFINDMFASGLPSEYYSINETKKMKKYFFNFMNKLIVKQNQLIVKDRKFINYFYSQKDISKDQKSYKRFELIQKRYKLKQNDKLSKYLKRIDIVPNSLVLAQAAIESGWGKNRFMKEGNNIFGQWTWTGNGLLPKNRDINATHKVKIFGSLEESIKGYMININIGWGYRELRNLRLKIRKYKAPLSGLSLSRTLINYSEQREKYIKLLAAVIIQNHLGRFDRLW